VPARVEWWGDDITSIRGFDLTTQRSLQELEEVSVLPVSTRSLTDAARPGEPASRKTLLELLPSDTFILQESAGADQDEVDRAWSEAEHHLDIARRLGEDVPKRDAILENPEAWRTRIAGFPRLTLRDDRADLQFGFFPPEKVDRDLNRLRGLINGSPPTLILCDNEGQLERLEELLEDGGRFGTRDLPPGAAAAPGPALPAGGTFARHRRADGRRLRGPPRPRHRDLSRHPDHHGRRGDDRGGDRRVRGR
jgi:transcription-repair coupling factor (superfamily II helicase)